jgi:hypothetical protein
MHVVLEKARKSAGISSLQKNYPNDPKQRGCGYWAAFIGSVGNDLAAMDERFLAVTAEKAELSKQLALLERKLSVTKDGLVANGMEAIALSEGWDKSKQVAAVKRLVG